MDLKPVVKTPDVDHKARHCQDVPEYPAVPQSDRVRQCPDRKAYAGKTECVFSATLRINHAEEKRMRKETTELLEMQGLLKYKDEIASSLPYGLQRRLEIARALATSPSLLLLDEPAAGMNPQETQDLTDFIRRSATKYKLTIFMIEHHMDLVMQISDRIYVLDFGRQIAQSALRRKYRTTTA
jgi:branched-chain amino acid transport system ATP-binding protein